MKNNMQTQNNYSNASLNYARAIEVVLLLEFLNSLFRSSNIIGVQQSLIVRGMLIGFLYLIFIFDLILQIRAMRINITILPVALCGLYWFFSFFYIRGKVDVVSIFNVSSFCILCFLGYKHPVKKMTDSYATIIFLYCIVFSITYIKNVANGTYITLSAALNTIYSMCLLLPLVITIPKKPLRLFLISLIIILTIVSHKGSLFIAIIGTLLISYLLNSKRKSLRIIGLPIIGFMVYYGMDFVIRHFTGFGLYYNYILRDIDSGGNGRTIIYTNVLNAIHNSDLISKLFGHGFNAVASASFNSGLGAHNDFLEILYDYGILGLILIIAVLYVLIKWMVILIKKDSGFKTIYTTFLFEMVVMMSLSNSIFQTGYVLIIVFYLFGIIKNAENIGLKIKE